jgi:hypothetical protein
VTKSRESHTKLEPALRLEEALDLRGVCTLMPMIERSDGRTIRATMATMVRRPTEERRALASLAILLLLAACSSAPAAKVAPKPSGATLSRNQISKAEAIVRHAIASPEALVLSATVIERSGPVGNSSTGNPCSSGGRLRIKLIGDFPRVLFSELPGTPGPREDFTALVITADAESGQPCRLKALTGVQKPQPGGTPLAVPRGPLIHPFTPPAWCCGR